MSLTNRFPIRLPMLMPPRYPIDIFPPTDFHTSTFYVDPMTGKEHILIIGGLGYDNQASRDRTDVYRLDLNDFSMHKLETYGMGPIGGTSHHKARLLDELEQPAIRVTIMEDKNWVLDADFQESDTIGEGKVFLLRIHDMRWI